MFTLTLRHFVCRAIGWPSVRSTFGHLGGFGNGLLHSGRMLLALSQPSSFICFLCLFPELGGVHFNMSAFGMLVHVCVCVCVCVRRTDGQGGLAVAMRCEGPRRATAFLAKADGRTDGRTNRRRDGPRISGHSGRTDRRTDEQTEGRTAGYMHCACTSTNEHVCVPL